MVAVFGGFAAGDLVMFRQMGFGLAVAVLIDATIVRSVLVPATMRLLGKWNWYFPRQLEWVPDISSQAPRPLTVGSPGRDSRRVTDDHPLQRRPRGQLADATC